MRKILYITNGINGSGGLERVLSIKASILADRYGYEVHILVLNQPEQTNFFTFSSAIHIHHVAASGNPLAYYKQYKSGLNTVVQKVQPDIISVCDDGFKGFMVPAIVSYKCPFIYERHASVLIDAGQSALSRLKNKVMYRLMQMRARTFDKFVILTEGNRKEWTSPNVMVIPNPIAGFPDRAAELTAPNVIAVGSQSYNKGYDRLLEAWQMVAAAYPDWHLNVYGRKNPEMQLDAVAETLGLSSSVSFHDPVADIEQHYRSASVMVLSSRSEGFGMVLIEAMACGVPCISFDCPHGPRDIITDGADGFLVPDGDIAAFADKVKLLMSDAPLRKAMGQKALATAHKYAPEQIVARWDQLFRDLRSKTN